MRDGDDFKEEIAVLARLRARAGKAAAQPGELQAESEEKAFAECQEISQRARASAGRLEEVPSGIAAKSSAASSRASKANTPARIAFALDRISRLSPL